MVQIRFPPAESPLRTRIPRHGGLDSPDRSRPGQANGCILFRLRRQFRSPPASAIATPRSRTARNPDRTRAGPSPSGSVESPLRSLPAAGRSSPMSARRAPMQCSLQQSRLRSPPTGTPWALAMASSGDWHKSTPDRSVGSAGKRQPHPAPMS
jgi:hypothetical protein